MNTLRAGSTQYEPTTEDRLWLLRAVAHEGPVQTEVASTLVNGFMWALSTGRWRRTLGDWCQAYAQPINPGWLPNGPMHLGRLANASSDAERNRLMAAAQSRVAKRARTEFTADVRAAVEAALREPPTYGAATDYAAAYVHKGEPWKPVTPAEPGKNRLWTRPQALGWTGYVVTLERAGGAAAFVLAALGAWLFTRGA
jgi:hypothetical protein